MFEGYTVVNNDGKYPWATWRDIILEKKQPRKMFVQHNTIVDGKLNNDVRCGIQTLFSQILHKGYR